MRGIKTQEQEIKLIWATAGLRRRVELQAKFAKLVFIIQQSDEQPKFDD